MKVVIPFTPLWFRKRRIYRSKAYFETHVQETLDHHPDLQEIGYLSVGITRDAGLQKPELHLFGQVGDERSRDLAIEIATVTGQGVVDIVNEVIVVQKPKTKNKRS
jgi:hypothetical protein